MTTSNVIPELPPDAVLDSLRDLASTIVETQRRMAEEWKPIVQEHIASGCTNINAIELTLDHLLDCACQPQGLALYRRLCRYLWSVDPAAAAYAVNAYREMWDPDDERPWAEPISP